MNLFIKSFFDKDTNNVTYLVYEAGARACAIIDPVLNFDLAAGGVATRSADEIVDYVKGEDLIVEWLLETHVHADHLTASYYLKEKLGGKIGISLGVVEVQKTFRTIYNLGDQFVPDGSQFDRLFADNDKLSIGNIETQVIHTPGHTPACATYVMGDCAFTGDTFFMPDSGTARCDFPGGSAAGLLIGKPLGIVGFSLLSQKLGLASLSKEMNLAHLGIVGLLGGTGRRLVIIVWKLRRDVDIIVDR